MASTKPGVGTMVPAINLPTLNGAQCNGVDVSA